MYSIYRNTIYFLFLSSVFVINLKMTYLISTGVHSRFIEECEDCQECKWPAMSSGLQKSVAGGGHTATECMEECDMNENCNFVSNSAGGYCHMSQHCIEKGTDFTWTRFRKKTYPGIPHFMLND